MNLLLGILGLVILIVLSFDILWTTLLIAGGGPLSTRLTSWVWRFLLFIQGSGEKHRLLSYGGLLVIVINLLFWVSFIWLGWLLIFNADPTAVLKESSQLPADFSSRIYYTGYTLITLGIGDYVAGNDFWQIVTVIASANGFIFVTLSITYLLPIVSAVVQKRQLAGLIYTLGCSPKEIITNAWNGENYRMLSQFFSTLTPQILEMGQKHLAYPILHCFHTYHRETAAAPNIVALDEALSMLMYGIDKTHQLDKLSTSSLRKAITLFLTTQFSTHISSENEIPPEPDFAPIRKAGITTVALDSFRSKFHEISTRRKLLHALVVNDGWKWEDVTDPKIVNPERLNANPTLLRKNVNDDD